MKKEVRLWLEQKEIARLKQKAEDMGFKGKGAISHYVEKIINENIVFLSRDIEVILRLKES